MKIISVPFVVVVLALSFACSDEEKCGNFATSSLTFTFSGFLNGTFSVSGEIPTSANISDYDWAMGGYFSEAGTDWMLIRTNLATTDGIQYMELYIPNTGIGKYSIPGRSANCGLVACDYFVFGYDDLSKPSLSYEFLSGEVTVTYSGCDRIMGTFNGILRDAKDSSNTMEITNGKFDVQTQCLWC